VYEVRVFAVIRLPHALLEHLSSHSAIAHHTPRWYSLITLHFAYLAFPDRLRESGFRCSYEITREDVRSALRTGSSARFLPLTGSYIHLLGLLPSRDKS
jgi:hypothetical protein